MRGCKWLTDMAAAAVGAAGAAAEAAAAAAAAAQPRRSAGAASSSEAGAAEAAAAASKQLQLSDEAAAQLAKELKIHPREARTAWEAVLYLTPQLASTPAAQVSEEGRWVPCWGGVQPRGGGRARRHGRLLARPWHAV